MRIRSLTTTSPATASPHLAEWHDVPDGPVESVIQDWHLDHVHGYRLVPDDDHPGMFAYLALIEVEGHEPLISRVYSSGIRRRGRRTDLQLATVAKLLGWSSDPRELLDKWEGEGDWV